MTKTELLENLSKLEILTVDGVKYLKLESLSKALGYKGNSCQTLLNRLTKDERSKSLWVHRINNKVKSRYLTMESALMVLERVGTNNARISREWFDKKNELEDLPKQISFDGISAKKTNTSQDTSQEDITIAFEALKNGVNKLILEFQEAISEGNAKDKEYYTITDIAKELGLVPEQLNQTLNQLGIQYRRGRNWKLKAKFKDEGLTLKGFTTPMRWTEKGRKFILAKLGVSENETDRRRG